MSYGLGIDLGASSTAAAIARPRGRVSPEMVSLSSASVLMRTAVRIGADGGVSAGDSVHPPPPELTGHTFRRRLGDSTTLTLAGREHTAGDLYAVVLAAVLETVRQTEGTLPDQTVVTFPAVWGPHRRERLADVLNRAGLARNRARLVSEAAATAAHFLSERPFPEPAPLVVYDAGGSSFDATVVHPFRRPEGGTTVEELGTPESLEWFGGVDLDEAVLRLLDESSGGAVSQLDPDCPSEAETLQHIREACIRAKESLAEAPYATIDVDIPGRMRPAITLSRSQLEEWVRPQLAAGLPALRQVLHSAGIGASDPATILLTGGTARIPLLGTMLADDLNRPVLRLAEPQHAAALGAAAIARNTFC